LRRRTDTENSVVLDDRVFHEEIGKSESQSPHGALIFANATLKAQAGIQKL